MENNAMTQNGPAYRTAIGQDSHRFEPAGSRKPLMLGGYQVPDCVGLAGNSDADVVLHALTNAISGVSGVNILGRISDELCLEKGIIDSAVYLADALKTLGMYRIAHISISIEAKQPKLADHIPHIKQTIARLCFLNPQDVGVTATSGEGLTDFGRGEGMQVFAMVTAERIS